MNEYIKIGKIAATFGIKGELILVHALAKKLILTKVEAIFVEEVKGSFIPYFLNVSKAKSTTESFISLEGIISKEQGHRLVSKPVWLLDADFRRLAGKQSPISLLGYQLINQEEPIGTIEEVIEQPHQVLLKITYQSKEALIPLHDQTLQKIDRKEGKVYVTLPDGLLEIYTE